MDLDLKLYEGEKISIVGPSGCGKSTMLNILAGIIEDFDGKIYLNGVDISEMPSNKRNIVIVSQENLLFPHMNVYENIAFPMRVRKMEESIISERVKSLLEDIDLINYEKKRVNNLSGGEKQRVALARAIASNPEVLLLDEAYSSLDPNLREKMRDLTIDLQNKYKISMILVTHDKDEAIIFGDRVGIMFGGTIRQIDIPKKLYENPNDIDIAKFLIKENYISPSDAVEYLGFDSTYLKDSANIIIKAEDIRMDTEIPNRNLKIIDKKYLGARTRYSLKVDNLVLLVDDYSDRNLDVGILVGVNIRKYLKF